MIKSFVGVTDREWFDFLRQRPQVNEINFWQPSGKTQFRALKPGEMFLFKLHSPLNYIVGGGVFTHSSILPISLAWEAFGPGNGASDLMEMKNRVAKYRSIQVSPFEDYRIGCILLEQPFYFQEKDWIPVPEDWKPNLVRGKTYDLSVQPGRGLWSEVSARIARSSSESAALEVPAYGDPVLVKPRLGQGGFRVLVTDSYQRRCAFSGEKTLPALDAAHIKPYTIGHDHSVSNGILLRKDIHALFDRGYITVSPDYRIEVSRRIKEEFENGRDYYKFHGTEMRLPVTQDKKPDRNALEWHNDTVFLG
ncbi:restriction endonuclease [Candidatus Fermentibacteria bacterium]|nr:MAG: restriction endonuclease [Candidatus Fermentibacteria bacterium]